MCSVDLSRSPHLFSNKCHQFIVGIVLKSCSGRINRAVINPFFGHVFKALKGQYYIRRKIEGNDITGEVGGTHE